MLHSAGRALNRFLLMEISVCEKLCTLSTEIDINSSLLLQMSASTHCALSNTSQSDNTKTKLFSNPRRRKVLLRRKIQIVEPVNLFHPKIKSNNEKQNQPWESSLMCSHTHHRTTAVWSRGKKRASSRISQALDSQTNSQKIQLQV